MRIFKRRSITKRRVWERGEVYFSHLLPSWEGRKRGGRGGNYEEGSEVVRPQSVVD